MGYRARHAIPDLGVGVGLRSPHYAAVLDGEPSMDCFEIISENFMVAGGRPRDVLARLRRAYRVIPHGVSLAIGSVEPLDRRHLAGLRALADELDAPWISDHLCWGRAGGLHLHDLLPLPYTEEAVAHVVERIKRVQGALERPFAVENVSSYMELQGSTMTEWQFLGEIVERADCGILLDVNNVVVSAKNHGFDPHVYVDALPADRVVQMHLAGHTDKGDHVLDTHAEPVPPEVWDLYARAVARCSASGEGAVTTIVEWDDAIPAWEVLAAEASRARASRGA